MSQEATALSEEKEEILETKEVIQITKLGRTKIWQLQKEGKFPKRRKITDRKVGWLWSEILQWMKSREKVI